MAAVDYLFTLPSSACMSAPFKTPMHAIIAARCSADGTQSRLSLVAGILHRQVLYLEFKV